ncbi:M15 family metallopeptidase [Weissella koreensis]|uniref:D-alanyl-D-alanine dipeptidase n=1 Tax=Weissella koreensis TaxID=165096 RepID=A0A7H1MMT7_9LACO|nr:M15 family metallopeptidase [Weissella koreensis]AVH75570.1 D-alanyl-D-alanine dipeptidase [Weissella koreensis]QGN20791.1 D-alanyl-D-alanine dipeptidase [Weissella koreensis]QNT64773.1 M15 family metallopeptidase [Weissella koreensis]
MGKNIQNKIPTDLSEWDWSTALDPDIKDNNEPMVPLGLLPEKIIVQPAYFIQNLSGAMSELYARQTVQSKLVQAANLLPAGYKLVIFDAWRSVSTQAALFHSLKRKIARTNPSWTKNQMIEKTLETVAQPSRDPKKPSPHNTGGSIDLTIVDDQGVMLDMASPFDDFNDSSKTNYLELKAELNQSELKARDNRRLLYHIMTEVGFTNLSNEWWHYDYGNQNWASCSQQEHALYGATKPFFPWVTILD